MFGRFSSMARAAMRQPVDRMALEAEAARLERAAEKDRRPDLICGLDLAQSSDYSALCVVERRPCPSDLRFKSYFVRFLKRWRGKPYDLLVEHVSDLMGKLCEAQGIDPPPLVVDGSGVGRPVVDMFRRSGIRAKLIPVLIVAGQGLDQRKDADEWGYRHVPKVTLVSTMEAVVTHPDRFRVSPGLEHAKTLGRELLNFTRKTTRAGNETFEAVRESVHDDLCLSVALAVWWGERGGGRQLAIHRP